MSEIGGQTFAWKIKKDVYNRIIDENNHLLHTINQWKIQYNLKFNPNQPLALSINRVHGALIAFKIKKVENRNKNILKQHGFNTVSTKYGKKNQCFNCANQMQNCIKMNQQNINKLLTQQEKDNIINLKEWCHKNKTTITKINDNLNGVRKIKLDMT